MDAAEIISQLADILVPGALLSISAEGSLCAPAWPPVVHRWGVRPASDLCAPMCAAAGSTHHCTRLAPCCCPSAGLRKLSESDAVASLLAAGDELRSVQASMDADSVAARPLLAEERAAREAAEAAREAAEARIVEMQARVAAAEARAAERGGGVF